MTWLSSLVATLLTCGFIWLLPHLLLARAAKYREARQMLKEFCEHAELIVADPRTPDDVADFVMDLASKIDSRAFVRRLFWLSLTGRFERWLTDEIRYHWKEIGPLKETAPDLFDRLLNAIASAIVLSTVSSYFLGWFVRRAFRRHSLVLRGSLDDAMARVREAMSGIASPA